MHVGFAGYSDYKRSIVFAEASAGHTGQDVTILGLGAALITVDFHRNLRNTEAESRAIVETALEGGVRYFDTSPDYKESEIRLGPALGSWRDKVFLTTKTNFGQPKKIREEFANSLKLLKTDHVDLLLLHCVGLTQELQDPKAVLGKGGAIDVLREAKKQGQTRFIGMSVHLPLVDGTTPEGSPSLVSLKVLEGTDQLDVVMPWVNYVSRALIDAETRIVAPARKKKMGVVAMKVLGGGGQLADDYDRAFRYTLSVPGVACALIGAANVQEMSRAVKAAKEFRPLTEGEMQESIALGQKLAAMQSPKAMLLHKLMLRDSGSQLA